MATVRTGSEVARIPVRFVSGANTWNFLALPEVRRLQFDDSPAPVPTSGEQQVKARPYHNVASIKAVVNAYAHEVERYEAHGGLLDHLYESEMDTRWGAFWLPPAENNPAMATDVGISVVAGPATNTTTVRPQNQTGSNRNSHAYRYFVGSTNSGIFTWRVDDVALNNYDLDILRWDGTAWGEEANIVSATAEEKCNGLDFEIHKGLLRFLYVGGAGTARVTSSGDGDTFTDMTAHPGGAALAGSRMITFGDTLYVFMQVDGARIDLFRSSDMSGTATAGTWASTANILVGQLVDVGLFYDRGERPRIVVLTTAALYWIDTVDYIANELLRLPYRGRGFQEFGGELLIFMDQGRVMGYRASGAFRDISPGGSQGMPDGKDFGRDTTNSLALTTTARGVYALWSGADSNGTDLKPLILFWNGVGWHYIWDDSAARPGEAARLLFYDPISGDLVGAIYRAGGEDNTFIQFKYIEVAPDLQATLDRAIAGYIVTPRLDFDSPIIPTTVWDVFFHTKGLGTGKSANCTYRIDGSTGAYTGVGATTTDNNRMTLPSNAATDAGISVRDIQFRFDFIGALATDSIKTYSVDIGFARIWPLRYLYVVTVDLNAKGSGIPAAVQAAANLESLAALTTKVQFRYGNSGIKMVLPIPPQQARHLVSDLAVPSDASPINSLVTLYLLEA